MRKKAMIRFFMSRCNHLPLLRGKEKKKIWFATASFAIVPFFSSSPSAVFRYLPDTEWESNEYVGVFPPRRGVFGRVSCTGTLHLFLPQGKKFRYWRGDWGVCPPPACPAWVKAAWQFIPVPPPPDDDDMGIRRRS